MRNMPKNTNPLDFLFILTKSHQRYINQDLCEKMERTDFTQVMEGKSRNIITDFRCMGDLSLFCSKLSSSLGNCQVIRS